MWVNWFDTIMLVCICQIIIGQLSHSQKVQQSIEGRLWDTLYYYVSYVMKGRAQKVVKLKAVCGPGGNAGAGHHHHAAE